MLSFIPSYQTLGPLSGWKWNRREALPYPLNHDRTRFYYLGRNAIFHGAKACGLGPGDEVLFPSYYSGTESAPLRHLGCQLTYFGVQHDLSIDLDEIEAKITPRTRAIHAIHFHGFPTAIEELRQLADRHDLVLIEDVALSFLSCLGDRPLGTWGDFSIFCIYKTMPVGNGGLLSFNRQDVPLPEPARGSSLYSELNLTAKHVLNHIDLRGRLVGTITRRTIERCLQAAVAIRRPRLESPDTLDFEEPMLPRAMGPITRRLIPYFDYQHTAERRCSNYGWMVERLRGRGIGILHEQLPPGAVPLFFPVLVEDKFGTVDAMRRQKIDAIPVWGIHHPELPRGEFPGTEFLVNHLVEIPIHQDLTERHLDRIARALIEIRPGCPEPAESSLCAL